MSFRSVAGRWLRALSTLCAIVGPILLVLAASVGLYDWNFIRHAASTTGTVIQFDERPDEDEDGDSLEGKAASYAPVFTFTVDEETYTVHSGSSAKRPAFVAARRCPFSMTRKIPSMPESIQPARGGFAKFALALLESS